MLHIFRNYSALIVVICSAVLVAATNFTAGKESSGFLFGYFGGNNNYSNPLENKMSILANNQKSNLALAQLAQASTAPDPKLKEEKEENSIDLQGQVLIADTSPTRKDPEEDGGVTIYEVQTGDTISGISAKYHLATNTILWANAIDDIDSIMPGDKIFILPADGLSYTVQKNDNIDLIAQKYKADKEKIIAFNSLPANGEIKEGDQLIVPDGQKEIIRPAAPAAATPSQGAIASRPYEPYQIKGKRLTAADGNGHSFPYGYCTWYVAKRRGIPWGGNAGTWLYHAKSYGYATGKTPKVGAVMVSSESWWGHVAIVESVRGNEFTISEMNYKGFAKKSYRTLASNSRVIKGFIY